MAPVTSALGTALIVVEVQAGSPAASALLVGDIILSVDGTAITDPSTFARCYARNGSVSA